MLCRCIRIAAIRGGGGGGAAAAAGAGSSSSNRQRILLLPLQPVVPLSTGTAPPRPTNDGACKASAVPLAYYGRSFLERRTMKVLTVQQQQQRCMSAAVATEEDSEEEPVKHVDTTPRKVRPDEVDGIKELRVQLRPENEQAKKCKRVRKAGMTPGIVYGAGGIGSTGPGERFFVKTNTKWAYREIRRLQSSFESTVYELVVESDEKGADGKPVVVHKTLAMPNEVRLHGVHRELMNINFIRFKPGRRHSIPIRFVNDDLNLNIQKKGAIVLRLKTHQSIVLPENPEDVPKWLDLDLEHVRSGNKLRVRDIKVPPGITLFQSHEAGMFEEVICSIKGKKILLNSGDDDEPL